MPLFLMICEMLAHQGWMSFFSSHQVFYPLLVQEFYNNMVKIDEKLVTFVRGSQIIIKPSMFAWALKISTFGATLDMRVPLDEAIVAMTQDDEVQLRPGRKLNANSFPPMQRLLHHMFTTIVYSKGGSRDEVTVVHCFLFYCLFNAIEVNLPDLMFWLIEQCHKYPHRVLSYATQLTLFFARFASPSLIGVKE